MASAPGILYSLWFLQLIRITLSYTTQSVLHLRATTLNGTSILWNVMYL